MIALIWPLVILFTVMLYGLMLLSLPFSSTWATFFLFTLIAFWSRLPGVGIPSPLWLLYVADVIDVLAMIVAINMGGIYGGVLSLFANIGGRACGYFTPWGANLSDAIAMFFTCLIIPFVHPLLGGDLFLTMVAFMIIRIIIIIPLDFLGFYQIPLGRYIVELIAVGAALFFFNSLYTKVFGDFFDNLLKSGVAFSWTLFTFATIVILSSYLIMFVFSKKARARKSKKKKEEVPETFKEYIQEKWRSKTRKKKLEKKDTAKEEVEHLKKHTEPEHHKPHPAAKKEKRIDKVDRTTINTIEKGCPVCQTDVKGNNKDGFYCPECETTYRRRELLLKRF
ncbi:hypothetical protein ACFL1B_06405 [Nanoarchaeota archaeon]